MIDRYIDLQRQGFMKAGAKAATAKGSNVSDEQFRENIRRDVARRIRIMFGEE